MYRFASIALIVFTAALSGCEADLYEHPRGDPTPVVAPLDETHPGWLNMDCAGCHSETETHDGAHTAPACGQCHGSNGGPLRPANHWLTHCNDCHAAGPEAWNSATHAGYDLDAPTTCRYCHQ